MVMHIHFIINCALASFDKLITVQGGFQLLNLHINVHNCDKQKKCQSETSFFKVLQHNLGTKTWCAKVLWLHQFCRALVFNDKIVLTLQSSIICQSSYTLWCTLPIKWVSKVAGNKPYRCNQWQHIKQFQWKLENRPSHLMHLVSTPSHSI